MPTKDILNAVRISIAKKYGVQQEDLYNEFSLSNDLISEIMGNSFLSSDQKLEFCELLQTMKKDDSEKNKEFEVVYLKDKDSISSKYNSILLAMTSFAMVLTMTFFITSKTTESEILFKDKFSLLIVATAIPIGAMTILYTLLLIKRKERERNKKKEDIEIENEKNNS